MHEGSVAADIFAVVNDHARKKKLKTIRLDIGALSGINSDSLLFHLEFLLKQKKLKDASVEITAVPARYICEGGHEYEPLTLLDGCPECGKLKKEVVSGTDCIIKSIEVDND